MAIHRTSSSLLPGPTSAAGNRKSASLTSINSNSSSQAQKSKRASSVASDHLSDLLAEEIRRVREKGEAEMEEIRVAKTKCLLFEDGDIVPTNEQVRFLSFRTPAWCTLG